MIKVGDVFRNTSDVKYTMTVKQVVEDTEDEVGKVVWDGIYCKNYTSTYQQFLEWVNNGFWEKISYEAK